MLRLNGLSDKFDGIHYVIRHRNPFPNFSTARSMLQSEETRLQQQLKHVVSHASAASSPHVLYASNTSPTAPSHQSYNNNNRENNNKNRGHGGGRRNRGRGRNNNSGSNSGHSNSTPYGYPSWHYGPPQWPYPYYHGGFLMMSPPQPYGATLPSVPSSRQNNILGPYSPRPHHEAHMTQDPKSLVGSSTMIPSALAHAFGTMTLQDPAHNPWYMDTAATDHITAQQGTLHSVFNSSITPSVLVSNGSSAPITKIGQGTLFSPSRPLRLNNVLVCPQHY